MSARMSVGVGAQKGRREMYRDFDPQLEERLWRARRSLLHWEEMEVRLMELREIWECDIPKWELEEARTEVRVLKAQIGDLEKRLS